MQVATLISRSLFFHARSNLAVLLGVMVGTAVLTGALLVGDSLRGSLRAFTLERLGAIDHALVSERFFGADLVQELTRQPGYDSLAEQTVPVVLLRGSVLKRDAAGKIAARAGRVQIVGVDERFWPLFGETRGDLANTLVINGPLAAELDVGLGDLLEVRLEKPQAVPSDSILGRPVDDAGLAIEASPVAEILAESGAGRFSLSVQQSRPQLLLVQLGRVQNRLRESMQAGNLANALLIAAPPAGRDQAAAESLQAALRGAVRLEDLGLRLRPDHSGQRYLSLESRRLLVEPAVVEAVTRLARERTWQAVPTLTYLANRIEHAGRFAAYATITGLDPLSPTPFGPIELVDGKAAQRLKDDEILINDWLAQDLWPQGDWQRHLGQPVLTVSYFLENEGWLLKEERQTLRLAGVVKLAGAAADRTLTPEFPGIRGTSVRDWKPPFPAEQWHPEWITDRDDLYWRRHRATPKAFVSPELAQKLWKSRHGSYTSVRLTSIPFLDGTSSTILLDSSLTSGFEKELRERLRAALPPETLGLLVQPVKAQGLAAAGSSTAEMFGWLFLGFSSFLIAAAAMLVGLLFRLGIERRAKEIGLLYAAGYPQRTVRRLLLSEGAILAAAGGVLGLVLALGYAWLLLAGLQHYWQDTLHTSFLRLHVAAREPLFGSLPYPSLTIGFALGAFVALLAISWAIRGLAKLSPRALLAGQTLIPAAAVPPRGRLLWVALCFVAALLLTGISFAVPPDVAAPLFFGSGALVLVGGLIGLLHWLRRQHGSAVRGQGTPALIRLGTHNADRAPGRSLLTIGLLASATFLVVAVESFRKSGSAADTGRESGTGGFALMAEADVPLFQTPAFAEQRRGLLGAKETGETRALEASLVGVHIFGLRVRPGDDVSCLNLYQPQEPRILGVPSELRQRGGFAFGPLFEATAEENQNPWRLLERTGVDEIPVLADDHTAQWVLKKKPGDAWTITDELGKTVTLRLVGLLKGSIFQSELLMAEERFRAHFPSRGGYGFFLIEAPEAQETEVKHALELAFGERFGLTLERSVKRLADFRAVENTYLGTFQVLGGLGVLLGTLGLAVVLLRNVWERRGELALLRALGYAPGDLGWLVFAENGFLVVTGLALGILAALIAVTPHVLERAAGMPWLGMLALIGLVFAAGLGAGLFAVRTTLRTPLLPALRRE